MNWAIGIQGITLPSTAQSLALSNTGMGFPFNTSINASYNLIDTNEVSFSSNYWFEGVSGKTISNGFGKHEFSLNTFSINDLELWGDKPGSDPLGEFGLEFSCLSYRYLFNQFSKQNLGIKLKGVYSKLYTENIYGLLFDIGANQKFNKYLNMGLTIKNVGYINSDLVIPTLPSEYGLGFSLNYDSMKLNLLLDIIYSDINKEVLKFGLIKNSRLINIFGSFVNFKTNQYLSTGFQMKYKNLSFSYGILFQKVKVLGIPQSFQMTLYY
tara:strand:- start:381 stop:1184 length:804 start_codon:yes stop_codon:yes gene_type:complete